MLLQSQQWFAVVVVVEQVQLPQALAVVVDNILAGLVNLQLVDMDILYQHLDQDSQAEQVDSQAELVDSQAELADSQAVLVDNQAALVDMESSAMHIPHSVVDMLD